MIVVFNGPPGSGKDEAAGYLSKTFGFHQLSFKSQLFAKTTEHFGVSTEWFMKDYDNRTVKERPELVLGNRSRREALIYVSEEIIKPVYGSDYFGKCVAEQINPDLNYVISDSGFVDELAPIVDMVHARNMMIVQLTRRGCGFEHDSRRYLDCMDNIVDEIVINFHWPVNPHYVSGKLPVCVNTVVIHNNGTLPEFHAALHDLYHGRMLSQ